MNEISFLLSMILSSPLQSKCRMNHFRWRVLNVLLLQPILLRIREYLTLKTSMILLFTQAGLFNFITVEDSKNYLTSRVVTTRRQTIE